ncbi:MAG TPA: ABC transporter ATP-binding protein [Gaiellaceae bacterium]|nr:ABC transporter ATP-binding protein [Gaiellaceae bacterium]
MARNEGTPVIRASALTKSYGRDRGIESLDFDVEQGEIFGFLGPNGAGKTTTIRLLLDLIRPTSGIVRLFGVEPRSNPGLRRRIGYLPGDLRLYEHLTGREILQYFAELRGLSSPAAGHALAERFGLELDRPVKSLSRGNRQKIGIVQAFMHDPELIILDEPTSGLDPLVQQTFYALLLEVRSTGRTVFLSSHVLPEVQHVADRVALLREGKVLLIETVEALRSHALTHVEVTLAEVAARDAFAGLEGVQEVERHNSTILFALRGEIDPLVKALAAHHVLGIDSHEADLEDVFLSLYRQGHDAP